ncbi:hypothetical protein HRbin16_00549 [bacterium HR16]|nr:hypothetical protein HRbin16_00549 [bacterium HR16]
MRCVKVLALWCMAATVCASSPSQPVNLDDVVHAFRLPPAAQQQLLREGVLLLADTSETNLWKAYDDLGRKNNLPLFVTTDACLYQFYELHKSAVRYAEESLLLPMLRSLLGDWVQAVGNAPLPEEQKEHTLFVLCVAGRLADDQFPVPQTMETRVTRSVQDVLEAKRVEQEKYPFGEDYTQYQPRGHYARSESLRRYFRAYQWLARRVYDMEKPDELRRTVALLLALQATPDGFPRYRRLVSAVEALAGEPVGIPLTLLHQACERCGVSPEEVLSSTDALLRLQRELAKPEYPEARIVTHLVPRQYTPAPASMPRKQLRILPSAQMPDSEVLQNTGDPQIPRRIPSGLDVAAALGSQRAEELLRRSPDGAQVIEEVTLMRQRWQAMRPEDWQRSVYLTWLWAIQAVLETDPNAPAFTRSSRWLDWKLNTALASWAHLRHAYGLYSAPVYIYMGLKEGISRAYLEPNPRCYERLALASEKLAQVLAEIGAPAGSQAPLQEFVRLMRRYSAIAYKELREEELSEEDLQAIDQFPDAIFALPRETPVSVMDIVTHSQTGQVLHVASGALHPVLVVVDARPWQPFIAVGWSLQYYELVRPNFQRLTDAEWEQWLQRDIGRPTPPEWTLSFRWSALAEREGYSELHRAETLLSTSAQEGTRQLKQLGTRYRGKWAGAKASLLLARHFLANRQYVQAEDALREFFLSPVLELWPEAEELQAELLNYLYTRSRWQAAQPYLRYLQQAARSATTPQQKENLHALALLWTAILQPQPPFSTSMSDEATVFLERVLKECPHSVLVPAAKYLLWQKRIDLWSDGPVPQDAAEEGLQIIQSHPSSLAARLIAQVLTERLGRNRDAAEKLAQAVGALSRPRNLLHAFWEEIILNPYPLPGDFEPRNLYERLVLLRLHDGDFAGAWEAARKAETGEGGYQEAALLLKIWQEEGEEPARAALRILQMAEQLATAAELTDECERYIQRFPRSLFAPWCLLELARGYARAGNKARSQQLQQRLLAEYPDSLEAGEVQESIRQKEAAIQASSMNHNMLVRYIARTLHIDAGPYVAMARERLSSALEQMLHDHPDKREKMITVLLELCSTNRTVLNRLSLYLDNEAQGWLQSYAESHPDEPISVAIRWRLRFGDRIPTLRELPEVYPLAIAPPGTPYREETRRAIEQRIRYVWETVTEEQNPADLLCQLAEKMPLYRGRLLLRASQILVKYRDWHRAKELLGEVARSSDAETAQQARRMLARIQEQETRIPTFKTLWQRNLWNNIPLAPAQSVQQCLLALVSLRNRVDLARGGGGARGNWLMLYMEGRTLCFRVRDGKLLWQSNDLSSPVLLANGVVVAEQKGNTVGVDANTGKTLWERKGCAPLFNSQGDLLLYESLKLLPPGPKQPITVQVADASTGKTVRYRQISGEELQRMQPLYRYTIRSNHFKEHLLPSAYRAWQTSADWVVFLRADATLMGGKIVQSVR